MANKYHIHYGWKSEKYSHHKTYPYHKIENTFDKAKEFINNLPVTRNFANGRFGLYHLYAKIRCEGKDFWFHHKIKSEDE